MAKYTTTLSTEVEIYPHVIAALKECLSSVPFMVTQSVDEQPRFGGSAIDMIVNFTIEGKDGESSEKRAMILEVKRSGHPGMARSALDQLRYYDYAFQKQYPEQTKPVLVFAAPFISKETAHLCQEAGINHLDLAGNCRITFDTVYVEKTGSINRFTRQQNRKSLFAPKAERALRVLLGNPLREWQVQEISGAAGISLGTASDVKGLLMERDWIATDSGRVRLTRPDALLKEWAAHYDSHRSTAHEFYSLKPLPETEAAISQACNDANVRYAFTGFSGAARHTAFVRYNKISAYVTHDIEKIALAANLKRVTGGANVTLLSPYDEGVYFDSVQIDGTSVASPLQVYLDLLHGQARAEEAAEHLYRNKIVPLWSKDPDAG